MKWCKVLWRDSSGVGEGNMVSGWVRKCSRVRCLEGW